MAHTITVGSRIRSIRESKNITAEQGRAGLTPAQLERIEGARHLPSQAPLVRIARALGVRLGTFLDDSDGLGPVLSRREARPESISYSSETACSHNT
jgi:transcriptional regulator with XRE-family HTH domain